MSSGCKFSVDVHAPERATYVSLYKWPESDMAFVRSVAGGGGRRSSSSRSWVPGVVDSYSCRQMYLRSYNFTTKKESFPERTQRWLVKVRNGLAGGRGRHHDEKKRSKKGCVVVMKKLRVASRTVMGSLFGRLLSCTTSVDVMDGRPPNPSTAVDPYCYK